MFDSLSGRLDTVFQKLKKRGLLKQADVEESLKEIRTALLEADVALPVVKDFVKKVQARAVGQDVTKSVAPGHQVIKIVHETLVETLGSDKTDINLLGEPPVVFLMVGLQGSGKTTSSAKLARRLKVKESKKVMMASLDVYRPAAQEQLRVLGQQIDVKTLPISAGQLPLDITKRAMQAAQLGGYDVLILDTAGRLHLDTVLMDEVVAIQAIAAPQETLLVADCMTGQDAVNVAKSFHDKLTLSGIILTRVDGDSRGGAALSMRAVTGCPIKFLGVGEKVDNFEAFDATRLADRILGKGDIVALVEKAQETVKVEDQEKLVQKMQKGQFDLDDMATQLSQMRKMGGMEGILGMLPGVGKMKSQLAEANLDVALLKRQEAIISSMTRAERRKPAIIQAKRKKRIAAGSGTTIPEVNKILKQHKIMEKTMKRVSKMGTKGMMGDLTSLLPTGAKNISGLGGLPAAGLGRKK